MDLLRAIRLRALRSVVQGDRDYFFRKVRRWYSKTFFTPLDQVEQLPDEDLLQVFYEEHYEGLAPDDLAKARDELLVTEEEHYAQVLAEDADEAEMHELNRIVVAEEEAKKLKAQKAKEQKEITKVQQKAGPITPKKLPESDLPKTPEKLPPAITMKFVDEADFEAEIEGFGSMTQPPK